MNSNKTKNLKLLGRGQILPHLQMSISQATGSIIIVGPWLDAYFTGKVIDSLPNRDIEVSFLVRIEDDGVIDVKTLSALNLARENIENVQARTLHQLHCKVVIIDNETFYLGSANWYWYSLHESFETTVTGETFQIPELIPEIYSLWEKAIPLTREDMSGYHDLESRMVDVHQLTQK